VAKLSFFCNNLQQARECWLLYRVARERWNTCIM